MCSDREKTELDTVLVANPKRLRFERSLPGASSNHNLVAGSNNPPTPTVVLTISLPKAEIPCLNFIEVCCSHPLQHL